MSKTIFICFIIISCVSAQNSGNKLYALHEEEFLNYNEKDETKGFININEIIIDKMGQIYISDYRGGRILKFSNDGKLLKSIGRKGNGPGEFADYFFTRISPGNKLYAIMNYMERRDISVFNTEGKYLKRMNLDKLSSFFNACAMLDDGIAAVSIRDSFKKPGKKNGFNEYIAILDLNTLNRKIVYNKLEVKDPLGGERFVNIAEDGNKSFYFALNSKKEYAVFKCNIKGEMIKQITRVFKPVFMKGAYLDGFRNLIESRKKIYKKFPIDTKQDEDPYFNIINYLAVDSYDNLWAFTSERMNEEIVSVDMYDKNGNYKKTFYLKGDILGTPRCREYKIYKDCLYYSYNDKQGEPHLYRLKLPDEIWK